MFLRTNYHKEQLNFTNTISNHTNAALKNAVRVERLVIRNYSLIIFGFSFTYKNSQTLFIYFNKVTLPFSIGTNP